MSRDSKLFSRMIPHIPCKGDYAEVGVLVGRTFRVICDIAMQHKAMAHAFDSFEGMAEPSDKDIGSDGNNPYPKGRFNVGGPANFIRSMEKFGIGESRFKVWQGFVPTCFENVPKTLKFRYVRLDLDHYEPTRLAATWALSVLNVGGVISSHDFFTGTKKLASGGISMFVRESVGKIAIIGHDEDEIFIRKIK